MEHRTGPTEPTGEVAGDAAVWEQPLPWLPEPDPDTVPEPEAEAADADAEAVTGSAAGDPEPDADTEPAPEASAATGAPDEPAHATPSAAPAPVNDPGGATGSVHARAEDPAPVNTLAPEPSPAVTSAEPRRGPHPGPASDPSPAPEPEQASSSVPEPGAGSDGRTGDTLAPGAAAAPDANSADSEPGSDPNSDSNSTPGPGFTSSLGDGRPGRLSRLLATRATTSAPARGGADTDAAQPERSARLIGTVAAVSVLAALGLGTVAFMAVPGGDDSEPSAAHVEDAAVPTVGPDGSVLPSRSASPFPSARGHRSGDEPGKKPHVGKGGAKKGSSSSPDSQGPDPEHAPAGHDGTAVEAASPHKAGTKPATTQQSDSKPAANSGTKPATGDMIVGYASSRCVGVSTHKGSDGSPLTLQGCGGDAWQKWVFASDGSVRSMGLCMDIATASASNGAGIQLAHCNGGWAQKFNLNGSHDLVNTTIGKCVDAKDSGTSAGTRLQLWDCGGTSNQKWHLG